MMALVDQARLARIDEDAKRPMYWAEPETLADLSETVRALLDALGTMLRGCDAQFFAGRAARLEECQALYRELGGKP